MQLLERLPGKARLTQYLLRYPQAAALVAYILFISLWGYAELLERNKRYKFRFVVAPGSLQAHTVQRLVREEYARLHDEDETQPSSLPVSEPEAASKQLEEFSYTNNAFVRYHEHAS